MLNGSRTAPRYSVGADPEVRGMSPIFEAVDAMSLRDELQYWPRPPIPEIAAIIEICGQEIHDMLRGIITPRIALQRAQSRAEDALKQSRMLRRTPWIPARLKGKNILITGAAQGMGAQNARHFAAQGANLCLGDVNAEGVAAVAEEINASGNGKAVAVKLDVTSRAENAAAVKACVDAFGSINVALLNGRREQAAHVHGYRTRTTGTRSMDINAKGVLLGMAGKLRARVIAQGPMPDQP